MLNLFSEVSAENKQRLSQLGTAKNMMARVCTSLSLFIYLSLVFSATTEAILIYFCVILSMCRMKKK